MLDHESLLKLGWSEELIRAFIGHELPEAVEGLQSDTVQLTSDVLISDRLLVSDYPPIGDSQLRLT